MIPPIGKYPPRLPPLPSLSLGLDRQTSWRYRRSLAAASANLQSRLDSFFRSSLSSCVLLGSCVQLSQQKSPPLKYVQDNVLLERNCCSRHTFPLEDSRSPLCPPPLVPPPP